MLLKLLTPLLAALGLSLAACSPAPPEPAAPATAPAPPSILLLTLDTTRADALGFESGRATTPNLDALAGRGVAFSQAYSTVPTTLPAHASMMTGLYPADHGVHENARLLDPGRPLLAGRLRELGYATAAFVSGFPLAAKFGLAEGFEHYDDDFGPKLASPGRGSGEERRADRTTDRALAYLKDAERPLFLWVHYFDAHEPYDPPEPFRSEYPADPYLGEIAYMDRELGRLLGAFEARDWEGGHKILVAGDHGEGLGDHGETFHGNLLYQGVMRVPLIVAGTGIAAESRSEPVSIRQISATVRTWAGDRASAGEQPHSLLSGASEIVLGEAMKPFLQYGWRPQVMAVRGRLKVIRSGEVEIYDLAADPAEVKDLAGSLEIDPELRRALRAYPLPESTPPESTPPESTPPESNPGGGDTLSREDRERLASLGYVDWEGRAPLREDAPSPKDMSHLFADLDLGSGLFVQRRYEQASSVFERVLEQDPQNLMVCLRLAVAHSVTGRAERALELFERARRIDPGSVDLRHYLAMHHFRAGNWDHAAPLFESVLARAPGRLPALESLARIREQQGRIGDAIELSERIAARRHTPESLVRLGDLRMATGDTPGATQAFEQARGAGGEGFSRFLELGVLYLAGRRLDEARECLDRVPPDHPGHAMALFKRAQVSVLLGEPDRQQRIRLAYERADAATRRLIENEALFRGVALR